MHTFNRNLFACFGIAVLTAGCGRTPGTPLPKSVTSFCGNAAVDVNAVRRVVANVMDGNHFKSSTAAFPVKVKPQLDRFGGAVASWDESALKLPLTKALYARTHARLSGDVAVPNDGDSRYRSRLVYLGLFVGAGNSAVWTTAASTDLENVCP